MERLDQKPFGKQGPSWFPWFIMGIFLLVIGITAASLFTKGGAAPSVAEKPPAQETAYSVRTFSYAYYRRANGITPWVPAALAVAACAAGILELVKITRGRSDRILFSVVVLTAGCFFLYLSGSCLLHGGISILTEKESDAVVQTGVIEQVDEGSLPAIPTYRLSGKTTAGYSLTIDGEAYRVMDAGDLKPGDRVQLTYLPKSRFVLSIQRQR